MLIGEVDREHNRVTRYTFLIDIDMHMHCFTKAHVEGNRYTLLEPPACSAMTKGEARRNADSM